MTENYELVPEADVTEQQQPVAEEESAADDARPAASWPLEADPADVAEQEASVPHDEDEEFDPGS